MNDTDLLRAYTSGQEEAFRTIVEQYLGLVHSSVLRQVSDPSLAEDVTQAVFIALATKARHLPKDTILSAWLFRAARLAALYAMRTELRRRNRELEAAAMNLNVNDPSDSAWAEIAPHIDEALVELKEKDRAAVLLRFFQNKKLREVGRALGISEDAAQKRLTRAIEKLRRCVLSRKVTFPTGVLVASLSAHSVQAAPAGMTASIVAATHGKTASATVIAIYKAILHGLFWTSVKTAAVSTAGTVALLTLAAGGAFLAGQNSLKSDMVFAPAGTFLMGSPETEPGREPDESPQAEVTFTRPFWTTPYEVTQEDYSSLMHTNPSQYTGDLRRPVEGVTWWDAVKYCELLTKKEAWCLPKGYVYRLPTEAEWEHACRAGTTTPCSYPPGNRADDYAWYMNNSGLEPHPVGTKAPNPWGLYDMYGNVWEWCLDWHGPYPGGRVTDPHGPAIGTDRIVRGGGLRSRNEDLNALRSANRHKFPPTASQFDIGFRVVLAPELPGSYIRVVQLRRAPNQQKELNSDH